VKEISAYNGAVAVCSNVALPKPGVRNRVGLDTAGHRGWLELTPHQARTLAEALQRAADETEAEAGQ